MTKKTACAGIMLVLNLFTGDAHASNWSGPTTDHTLQKSKKTYVMVNKEVEIYNDGGPTISPWSFYVLVGDCNKYDGPWVTTYDSSAKIKSFTYSTTSKYIQYIPTSGSGIGVGAWKSINVGSMFPQKTLKISAEVESASTAPCLLVGWDNKPLGYAFRANDGLVYGQGTTGRFYINLKYGQVIPDQNVTVRSAQSIRLSKSNPTARVLELVGIGSVAVRISAGQELNGLVEFYDGKGSKVEGVVPMYCAANTCNEQSLNIRATKWPKEGQVTGVLTLTAQVS
ncbi:TPA: hypothetical protein ACJG67_004115 [Salmonella enterica subsp. enterica serovar Kottbus]